MTAIEQIIIEGDEARVVRVETVSRSLLKNLGPHLTTQQPVTLPIMPQNPVRFAFFDGEQGDAVFLVETSPRRAWMQMIHERRDTNHPEDHRRADPADGVARFHVALPWQYFAFYVKIKPRPDGSFTDFTIANSRLFWAKDAIRALTDKLVVAPCPNVDTDGRICWGSTAVPETHLSARIDGLVNAFWTTQFNEHLGHNTPFRGSMTEWEKHSEGIAPHRAWPIWDTIRSLTAKDVIEALRAGGATNPADLDPSYMVVPELPQNFTVARAREWVEQLPEGARRRLMLAITDIPLPDAPVVLEPAPEEEPA
jgi:hypothetical protein